MSLIESTDLKGLADQLVERYNAAIQLQLLDAVGEMELFGRRAPMAGVVIKLNTIAEATPEKDREELARAVRAIPPSEWRHPIDCEDLAALVKAPEFILGNYGVLPGGTDRLLHDIDAVKLAVLMGAHYEIRTEEKPCQS